MKDVLESFDHSDSLSTAELFLNAWIALRHFVNYAVVLLLAVPQPGVFMCVLVREPCEIAIPRLDFHTYSSFDVHKWAPFFVELDEVGVAVGLGNAVQVDEHLTKLLVDSELCRFLLVSLRA